LCHLEHEVKAVLHKWCQ